MTWIPGSVRWEMRAAGVFNEEAANERRRRRRARSFARIFLDNAFSERAQLSHNISSVRIRTHRARGTHGRSAELVM